jgi:protein-L-isoaspartate(D-aspartate) O-methyltransferase
MRPVAALATLIAMAGAAFAADDYAGKRRDMVETVRAIAAEPGSGAPGGRISEPVLAAMNAVPRHELVPEPYRRFAYRDGALPIGFGQTISQPYIVALMTELLGVDAEDDVLEVGTGSGYQAAVLATLARRVYTIEIIDGLARRAADDRARLGYRNVEVRAGDGYKGWPEHAPFDGIIVTAAAPELPPPLLDQLKPGGRLVIPLGSRRGRQSLMLIEKGNDGRIARRSIIEVRFVPLTRERR